jgi:hypothetical protein
MEDDLSIYEKREELHRVLQSRSFVHSPRKTRFLSFVAEQTFQGNSGKLNEYLIGSEVYARGADFDQQKDPIVRVQAHEIRRLLKRYYEEEGKQNPIRMDLPAGGYVPVFARVQEEFEPPPTQPDLPQPRSSSRIHMGITVALAIACVALATALSFRSLHVVPPGSRQAALPPELEWFWKPFLPPAAAPLIVIPNHPVLRAAHGGDSAVTVAKGHEIPKANLPEFRDTIHYHELKRFVFVPSLTDFTSVGETLALVRLCEMFYRIDDSCSVQQSRLTNLEEIKANNVILLGGNQAWSGRVFLNIEGFHFQNGVILNSNPQQGEQTIYRPEFDPVTNQLRRDYAVVLLLPNDQQGARVLLIYGIYTQGSQAAVEFLTNSAQMAKLRTVLTAASNGKIVPKYFQVLLTTVVENSVPGNTSIVAVRTVQQ